MFHIAELNIARLKYPLEDERMQDFVQNLDLVNAHAEAAEGFVWRYVEDIIENAADTSVFAADLIVNMSVWRDLDSLRTFMMADPHKPIMTRRREWFSKMETPHLVLWSIPIGHIPSLIEAKAKLELLAELGPSREAFNWAFALGDLRNVE